jgi:hypothetical protein
MRLSPRLGSVNLALVSAYFAPVWGLEAVRALASPFGGFDDRAHGAAASAIYQLFGPGLDALMRASTMLAAIKLIIAAGFLAYLIELVRALAAGRGPDRTTIDVALVLAITAVVLWIVPVLALGDGTQVRLYATQLMLVAGAVFAITIERHIEQSR